jgi:hypothetical protein
VNQVFNIITLQMGQEVMVAVKASMHEPDSRKMIGHINAIEKRLRERFPAVRWLFFEPDLAD